MVPRLKNIYKKEIIPQLSKSLGIKNLMKVPKIEKVVLNMGLGLEGNDNPIIVFCSMPPPKEPLGDSLGNPWGIPRESLEDPWALGNPWAITKESP